MLSFSVKFDGFVGFIGVECYSNDDNDFLNFFICSNVSFFLFKYDFRILMTNYVIYYVATCISK